MWIANWSRIDRTMYQSMTVAIGRCFDSLSTGCVRTAISCVLLKGRLSNGLYSREHARSS